MRKAPLSSGAFVLLGKGNLAGWTTCKVTLAKDAYFRYFIYTTMLGRTTLNFCLLGDITMIAKKV